jgi:hypothetical protein
MNSPYQTLALGFAITGHKANIYIKLLQSLCSYHLSLIFYSYLSLYGYRFKYSWKRIPVHISASKLWFHMVSRKCFTLQNWMLIKPITPNYDSGFGHQANATKSWYFVFTYHCSMQMHCTSCTSKRVCTTNT